MGVPLVQHTLQVRGQVPRCDLKVSRVNLAGLQPLQIQHVLLTVGHLVKEEKRNDQSKYKFGTRIFPVQLQNDSDSFVFHLWINYYNFQEFLVLTTMTTYL